jgi:hypothetical protein
MVERLLEGLRGGCDSELARSIFLWHALGGGIEWRNHHGAPGIRSPKTSSSRCAPAPILEWHPLQRADTHGITQPLAGLCQCPEHPH